MRTVKENLIAAKALIDTPEKWIKGRAYNEMRSCYCVFGAVIKTVDWDMGERARNLPEMRALAGEMPDGFWDIPKYNDDPSTTHADIMDLFDRAIAAQDEK